MNLPNCSPNLVEAATYEREIAASLERAWENVLDWEHLPWLHSSSFSSIELDEAGDWGWRVWLGESRDVIELKIDKPNQCYVAKTLSGAAEGTEIWTGFTPLESRRTRVNVAFRLPGPLDEIKAQKLGAGYVRVYTHLWDEDEAMMTQRQAQLDKTAAGDKSNSLPLGPVDVLKAALPRVVKLGEREYRIVEVEGELYAHAVTCPHLLGPLQHAPVEDACIRCPWHGYAFDVRDGSSRDGRRYHLPPAPKVHIADGNATLQWT